ncbi:hypothetical protein LINPERPRIM_LOCUS6488, partial [Linum perenne]
MASSSGHGQAAKINPQRDPGSISADEAEPTAPFSPVPLPGPHEDPPLQENVPGLHRFIRNLRDEDHWCYYWRIHHLKPTPGVVVDFE